MAWSSCCRAVPPSSPTTSPCTSRSRSRSTSAATKYRRRSSTRSVRRCSTSPRPRASPRQRGQRSSRAGSAAGTKSACSSSNRSCATRSRPSPSWRPRARRRSSASPSRSSAADGRPVTAPPDDGGGTEGTASTGRTDDTDGTDGIDRGTQAAPGEAVTTGFRRILLKLSGEAFAGETGYGIDGQFADFIATEIVDVRQTQGVDVAVVVGGGNIWRGMTGAGAGMDRAQADYMGMLATVINALALQDALERLDQPTRVQTAIQMAQIAEPYIRRRAIRHLEKGRVVILAAELWADALLKATHWGIDGFYTADPRLDPGATKLDELTYMDVLNQGLKVMDPTSITFCMDNALPIVVFDVLAPGNLRRVLIGEERIGTLVR